MSDPRIPYFQALNIEKFGPEIPLIREMAARVLAGYPEDTKQFFLNKQTEFSLYPELFKYLKEVVFNEI